MNAGNIKRLGRTVVGMGVALVLTAGCGGARPPSESVPALRDTLSAVDSAIAGQRFAQARRQIDQLVQTTIAAREAGNLDSAEAEPILAAATGLLSALPRSQAQPDDPEPPDDDEAEDLAKKRQEEREKRREELEKKREELEKKREELQKKREEEEEEDGDGDEGDGGGNGPDDGHGN